MIIVLPAHRSSLSGGGVVPGSLGLGRPYGGEVRMSHGLLGSKAFLEYVSRWALHKQRDVSYSMIITEKFVQKVNRFIANEALVLSIYKREPRLPGKAGENLIILRVELDLILVQVLEQLLGTEHLGDLDQLVGVAVTVEEGLFAEDHGSKHSSQGPHVQRVVVFLEINKKLGTLEVTRGDADVVFRALVVEFGKTPVDKAELSESASASITLERRPTLRFS